LPLKETMLIYFILMIVVFQWDCFFLFPFEGITSWRHLDILFYVESRPFDKIVSFDLFFRIVTSREGCVILFYVEGSRFSMRLCHIISCRGWLTLDETILIYIKGSHLLIRPFYFDFEGSCLSIRLFSF
jgi:hypothetical protein